MKRFMILAVSLFVIAGLVGFANADPKALPAGALVSAVCNGDGTATVSVSGVKVEAVHNYYYLTDEEVVAGPKFTRALDAGRRFNFEHGGGFYAGVSKEMAKKYGFPPSFLGDNIDVDNSDPRGACFIITCPAVRAPQKK